MPTKRTRTPRLSRDFMTQTHWAWLRDEIPDDEIGPDHDWLIWHHLDIDRPNHPEPDPPQRAPFLESSVTGRHLWEMYEAEILAENIEDYPGTRPRRWWQFSAPGPRRRLRGVGTPCHERLAHTETYLFGVPDQWITRRMAETYVRLGSPLDVPALDPADPPIFESEAAYLDRHELWAPKERKRVDANGFEPVSILYIFEFDPADLSP